MASGTAPNTSVVLTDEELTYVKRYTTGKSAAIHQALREMMERQPFPITVTLADVTPETSPYSQNVMAVPVLAIDGENNHVYLDWNDRGASGRQPMRSYYGFIREIELANIELANEDFITNHDELSSFLATYPAQRLLSQICDGSGSRWDGNNEVATYTDGANDALERLTEMINELPADTWAIWDAGDWFDHADAEEDFGITAETTDDELKTMAKAEDATALAGPLASDHIVIDGTIEWFTEKRDELREL